MTFEGMFGNDQNDEYRQRYERKLVDNGIVNSIAKVNTTYEGVLKTIFERSSVKWVDHGNNVGTIWLLSCAGNTPIRMELRGEAWQHMKRSMEVWGVL